MPRGGGQGIHRADMGVEAQELAGGRLSLVFDRPMETENSYYLVVPEGKLENPLSQAFRAWISKQVPA